MIENNGNKGDNMRENGVNGNKPPRPFGVPPKGLPKTREELERMLEARRQAQEKARSVSPPPRLVVPTPAQAADAKPVMPTGLPKRIEDLPQAESSKIVANHSPASNVATYSYSTSKQTHKGLAREKNPLAATRKKYKELKPDTDNDDPMQLLTEHEKQLIKQAELAMVKIKGMLKRIKRPIKFSRKRLSPVLHRRSARIPSPLWGIPMRELHNARSKLLFVGKKPPTKKRRNWLLLLFVLFSVLALLAVTTFAIITLVGNQRAPQTGYITINEDEIANLKVNNYKPGDDINLDVYCMNLSSGGAYNGKVVLRFYMYITLNLPEWVTPTEQELEEVKELKVVFTLPSGQAGEFTAGTVQQNGVAEVCMYYNSVLASQEVISLISSFKIVSRNGGVFQNSWENRAINVIIEAQAVEPSLAAVSSAWSDVPVDWVTRVGLSI